MTNNAITVDRQLKTPALVKMIEQDIKAQLQAEENAMEKEDWVNVEKEPCKVCFGTGKDGHNHTSPCIACEGTGTDYELIYGVEGGQLFARAKQYGIEAYAEYCRLRREEEKANPRAHWDTMGVSAFALPSVARIELIAQGVPVDEMIQNGEIKALAREVLKVFGDTFMTTNLKTF